MKRAVSVKNREIISLAANEEPRVEPFDIDARFSSADMELAIAEFGRSHTGSGFLARHIAAALEDVRSGKGFQTDSRMVIESAPGALSGELVIKILPKSDP